MDVAQRSIRTLAWLGDAQFELDVRRRLSDRGDYPIDRLDAMKAHIVCAARQAELLAVVEAHLDEDEIAIVRRARNTSVGGKARGRTDVRTHRSATALEALIAYWLADPTRQARYDTLLGPPLATAVDQAVALRATKLKRG